MEIASARGKAWWGEAGPAVANSVTSLVKTIVSNQSQHQNNLLKSYRLYGNFDSRGMSAGNYAKAEFGRGNRLTLNVIKSCVDTIVAQIGRSLPKVTFLTSGGSWSEQKKAKQLDRFTQGIFYESQFRKTAPRVLRDAATFGKGFVKILEDDRGRVRIERVFPGEIIVDEMEAENGEPVQIHQQRTIAREKLLGMFPEIKGDAKRKAVRAAIEAAPVAKEGSDSQKQADSVDLVKVIESWHLPSTVPPEIDKAEYKKLKAVDEKKGTDSAEKYLMDGHDGRHAISIEGHTLLIEAWRDPYFPFVCLDWSGGGLRGWWNVGLPIELCGIQYEINKISRKIQEAVDLCVPKLFVEAGSKVALAHLDNLAGGIIRFTGTKPVIEALQTLSPELLAHVDRLVRQAYEMSGVSQLAAQQRKPAGLESGASIREYNESQSLRFSQIQGEYEEFAIAVALQCIRLAKRIAERDGDYKTKAPSRRRSVIRVKWSEIKLDEDDYIMQAFPSSALPHTPAGRLAMVQDLLMLGFLERDQVIRLLDFPDLDAITELETAAAEFTSWQIERNLEDGIPEPPQPYQNLPYAIRQAEAAYMLAYTMDAPEAGLENLRNYMQACHAMLDAAAQEAAMQAGAGIGGGAPAGGAMPPAGPGVPPGAAGPGAPPPMPGVGVAS